MSRLVVVWLVLLAGCVTFAQERTKGCPMSENRHESEQGWSLCYPATLQIKSSGNELTLTNNRDPRNYFGFKVVVHASPLADHEPLTDGVSRLIARIKQGASKRDHAEVRRGTATLAGLPAQQVVLRYTLDAGRVEYTDPDGKSRSAGDGSVPIEVRLLAAEDQRMLLAAWSIVDETRRDELNTVFEDVLRNLRWRKAR